MADTTRIGVSACLLGENVRYDGGNKLDRFLRDTLGPFVEYVAVCPEVECGLTVPREAMWLVGDPEDPRLVTIGTKTDHTGRMRAWADLRLDELDSVGLCGFIFKSRSPSCGMERVEVYGGDGVPVMEGTGIWARLFMERFPQLPVEEDDRLRDPDIREHFIGRLKLRSHA